MNVIAIVIGEYVAVVDGKRHYLRRVGVAYVGSIRTSVGIFVVSGNNTRGVYVGDACA